MPSLVDSLRVKSLTLSSRLVMPPVMTNFATPDGFVTDALIDHYALRAGTGLGMITVEAAAVAPEAGITGRALGIWDDRFLPGLERLAEAIQGAGACAAIQLVHAGAQAYAEPSSLRAPSAVRLKGGPGPRPLTRGEIAGVIESFANAAHRAASAGFDAVEIHGAHYYLISQFLSPFCNHREDDYGGDITGRSRLALEVVRAVHSRVWPEYPVMMRLNGTELFEGGVSDDEARAMAKLLVAAGVDLLDVSGVVSCSERSDEIGHYYLLNSIPGKRFAPGPFLAATAQIKRATGVPVIAVGKLGSAELAQDIISTGQADLVALGRSLLADPLLVRKLLEQRDDIVGCQDCMSCLGRVIRNQPVRCTVNQELGADVE